MSIVNAPLQQGGAVYFDPYDVDINADPYPVYARLREEAPIYHNEQYDFWALSRHADVEKGLVNWQTFSNTRSDILDIIKAGVELPPGVILFEDPPLHGMHRGLMSRVFTPRAMAQLEDQVREFCVGILDPLVGSGGFDIITELASVMPMRVIGMLLGIPEDDQVAVRNKTDANLRTEAGQADGGERGRGRERRHVRRLHRVARQASVRRPDDATAERRVRGRARRDPHAHPPGGPHVHRGRSPAPGNETTGRLIGWLAKLLAEHPDQRREVVEDRSLIPNVIDETLRFEPTGHATARVRHTRRRVPRHDGARGQPHPVAHRRRPTATRVATPIPTCSTSTAKTSSTSPSAGASTSASAPNLARLEGRVALDEFLNRFPEWDVDLRRHRAGADVDGARLGAHADSSSPDRRSIDELERDEDDGTECGTGRRRFQRHAHRPATRRGSPRRTARRSTSTSSIGSPNRDGHRREAAVTMLEGSGYLDHPNFRTAGHHDSAARLADYDHDGIAAGVIFHGIDEPGADSVRGSSGLGKPKPTGDPELVGVGQSIYNRWLADFVAERTTSPRGARVPPDVGRRRRGCRGRVGPPSGTARRELPRHARR